MSAFLSSVASFALGGVVVYIAIRYVFGGVLHLAMKGVHAEDPRAEKSAEAFGILACYAHAAILDDSGDVVGAGKLVLAAEYAHYDPHRHITLPESRRVALLKKYEPYANQGNLSFITAADAMAIPCSTHGSSRWGGHIRCTRCRRIYGPADGTDRPAPAFCECGYRLLPAFTERKELLPASAGVCCKHCYKEARDDAPRKIDPPKPGDQDRPLNLLSSMVRWSSCPACFTELYLRFATGTPAVLGSPPEICPSCGHEADRPETETCDGHPEESETTNDPRLRPHESD